MRLDAKTLDRAVGAMLGAAAGDALGVHYETGLPVGPDGPRLLGGGFGSLAPGQWSDDTEMTIAIARVAAEGADLRQRAWLDDVADGFVTWYGGNPPDVGLQTRAVLSRARSGRHSAERLAHSAAHLHDRTGRTAGNGSLIDALVGCDSWIDRDDESVIVAIGTTGSGSNYPCTLEDVRQAAEDLMEQLEDEDDEQEVGEEADLRPFNQAPTKRSGGTRHAG